MSRARKGKVRLKIIFVTVLACALLVSGLPVMGIPALANITGGVMSASVLVPTTGEKTLSGGGAVIDYSHANDGYVMAYYSGSSKAKIQITANGGTTYTYDLHAWYEVFPLTAGNGSYTLNAFENVFGNQYAMLTGTTVDVALSNDRTPFLYPSQYVNFNADSAAVKKGSELAVGISDPLQIVANVYNWVIVNVKYDDYKAKTVQPGYLPAVDTILSSGKGICFDYAALMASMLRSQGIPTRLQVGYVSGGVYHAWLSVYTDNTGWINNAIYFDGVSWKLMDPTFAASSNQSSDVMQFIGNGTNYSVVYTY